jgi:predicted dehydrogenase
VTDGGVTAPGVPSGRRGPVPVGVVGAGNISGEYLRNLTRFPDTRVVAVGDIVPELARTKAAEHGIANAGDVSVVLDDPSVEIVVNLTVPAAHAEVALAAVRAGKHVWNEKPLTTDRATAAELLAAADRVGVRLGGAPDTFLGSGLQAARRLVDEGAIGTPLSAVATMTSPGPDAWHPNPAFFFQPGAGPLFDIGPYYLTALVQLLGAAQSVAAVGSIARATRVVGSGPLAGQTFPVDTPSHVGALYRFAGGASAQATFSFDAPQFRYALEITGTDGTLVLPDPNLFGGEICIRRPGGSGPESLEITTGRSTRGTGVLDMARAIRSGRPHRADGALAFHVLDTMTATLEAAAQGSTVAIRSRVSPAPPLPADWDPDASTFGS